MDLTAFNDYWSIYSDNKLRLTPLEADKLDSEFERLGAEKMLKAWRDYLSNGGRGIAGYLDIVHRLKKTAPRRLKVC